MGIRRRLLAAYTWKYIVPQDRRPTLPRYDYACADCEIGFEVSRSFKDADDPVACPICGEPAKRQMTVPMATYTRGAAAEKLRAGPASAPGGVGGPSSGGWYHHGHSHGPGTGGHKH